MRLKLSPSLGRFVRDHQLQTYYFHYHYILHSTNNPANYAAIALWIRPATMTPTTTWSFITNSLVKLRRSFAIVWRRQRREKVHCWSPQLYTIMARSHELDGDYTILYIPQIMFILNWNMAPTVTDSYISCVFVIIAVVVCRLKKTKSYFLAKNAIVITPLDLFHSTTKRQRNRTTTKSISNQITRNSSSPDDLSLSFSLQTHGIIVFGFDWWKANSNNNL